MLKVAKANPAVDHLLERACARNTPAKLHGEASDGQPISCKTRLLRLVGDRLLVEAPGQDGEQLHVSAQGPIKVSLLLNKTRFEFTTTILEVGLKTRLNQHVLVQAVALRKPAEIKEPQRRSYYRVTLAAKALPVTLSQSPCQTPSPRPAGETDFRARLADLSAGGCAVLVDRKHKDLLDVGRHFYLTFKLPDEPEALKMLVEVRHTQVIAANGSIKAGMAFVPWEGSDLKTEGLRITRFIARVERNALRRAR